MWGTEWSYLWILVVVIQLLAKLTELHTKKVQLAIVKFNMH